MKTKYKVGQVVWYGTAEHTTAVSSGCPDCLGSGLWTGKTPAGYTFHVKCETCKQGCESTGRVWEYQYLAVVLELTIGKVMIKETAVLIQVTYMCEETGIESGQVYDEGQLFPTKGSATCYAATRANNKQANRIPLAMRNIPQGTQVFQNDADK